MNLNEWSEDVVDAARRNVGAFRTVNGKRRRIDSSGRLRKGLSYLIYEDDKGVQIRFTSDVEYAIFVNEGVNGTESAYTTRFSYGSKQPPIEPILQWMKEKPLRLRDPETNQFVKATEAKKKGVAFAIARNIRKHGIAPTHFMDDAIEERIEALKEIMGVKIEMILIKKLG